ncbi:MAG: hypothetical protein OXQ29_19720 [Rhodospirillaceae bacterium]|nr:hypothetical protein [Rhodospirillaceae bacterium]
MDSPIRFMQRRLESSSDWFSASLPLAAYVVISAGASAVIAERTNSAIGSALQQSGHTLPDLPAAVTIIIGGGSVVMAGMSVFLVQAGALWAFDALTVQSGRAARLVELAALSYWTQVVYAFAALLLVAFLFEPPPLRVPSAVSGFELQRLLADYGANMQAAALPSSLALVRQMFLIWLVGLYACALRLVSGFSIGGAWAAGVVLAVLFVIGPAMVRLMF